MTTPNLKAESEDKGKRLDLFLSEKFPKRTRSFLKNLISEGQVSISEIVITKAGYKIKGDEILFVKFPEKPPETLAPEDIALDIVYEDDFLVVVNKPAHMAVHPGAGRSTGTLVAALLHHTGRLAPTGSPLRPGIVHRLDMGTTGVMVVAKDDPTFTDLARQFKEHTTERRYHALVWGRLKENRGTIDLPIGRCSTDRKKISAVSRSTREAVTHYKVIKRYNFFTLVELKLETGRTHQVRVHMDSIGHPVVGDPLYGKRKIPSATPKPIADRIKGLKRQLLHALSLGFRHPETNEELRFTSPYPDDMALIIELLDQRTEGADS